MAVRTPDIFGGFLEGRKARQEEQYGQARNALAQMELENAPQDMARRNKLADLQIQGLESQHSQEQVTEALKQTAAGAMRIAQSQNPQAEAAAAYPEFAAKLRELNPDWDRMPPEDARQYAGWIAGQAQSKLGIAPAQPKTPEAFTLGAGQTRYGPDGQPIASAPVSTEMTPYQKERLKLERDRLQKSGNPKGQFRTLSPQEVADAGLPQGTVAQTDASTGAIKIVSKPTASGDKPPKLTEGDKRARVLYSSVLNSEKDIANSTGADTSSGWERLLGSNPVTRGGQSDEYRKYESAALRWAANMLYLKSGATAPVEEVQSTWKQFFPQFGDGPEVIAQKEAARIQEMTAVADAFGLDKSQIPQPKTKPAGARAPGEVRVKSPQEAMALPPGTVFITPDGRRKVR